MPAITDPGPGAGGSLDARPLPPVNAAPLAVQVAGPGAAALLILGVIGAIVAGVQGWGAAAVVLVLGQALGAALAVALLGHCARHCAAQMAGAQAVRARAQRAADLAWAQRQAEGRQADEARERLRRQGLSYDDPPRHA